MPSPDGTDRNEMFPRSADRTPERIGVSPGGADRTPERIGVSPGGAGGLGRRATAYDVGNLMEERPFA